MAMIEKSLIATISGDTDVAGTLSIAALRGLYAVAFDLKPKKNPEELLPATPADRRTRKQLTKAEDEETIIINRSGRSTYPNRKSVPTSGSTPYAVARDEGTTAAEQRKAIRFHDNCGIRPQLAPPFEFFSCSWSPASAVRVNLFETPPIHELDEHSPVITCNREWRIGRTA
jgi:hypothetical protein